MDFLSPSNNNDNFGSSAPAFGYDIDSLWPPNSDLSEIFAGLTGALEKCYVINRGLLVLRETAGTRFLAVSTWNNGKTRKNLSIKIPTVSSLFEKVAEHGLVFSESFCALFSGNSFERKLLIDDYAQSYVLQPLKFEGEVVGLIGYSSEDPMAFATFEEGALLEVADQLAKRIGRKSPSEPTI